MDAVKEFAKLILNIDLRPIQCDILNQIDSYYNLNYLTYPTKFGASTILSIYTIAKALEGKSMVLVNDSLFEDIYRIIANSVLNCKTYNDHITIGNGSEIKKLPVKNAQYKELTEDQINQFRGFEPSLIVVDGYIDPFFAFALRYRKKQDYGIYNMTKYVASFPKYSESSYEHLKKLYDWYGKNNQTNDCKIINVDFQLLKDNK